MSIQLIFRNSFVTVELIGTGSNLCVNRIPVFKKPPILFFLSLQQTEQDFLDGARTGRLKQFLDSGFKSCVVDFDVHDLTLQNLVKPVLIVAEGQLASEAAKLRRAGPACRNYSETSPRQWHLTDAGVSTELWASTPRPVKQRPRVRLIILGTPSAALGSQICCDNVVVVPFPRTNPVELMKDSRLVPVRDVIQEELHRRGCGT